jgi:ABC-2 type transport system permease protein
MVKLVLGISVMTIAAFAFFSFHAWSLGLGLIPIAAVLLVVGWAISLFVMGIVLRFGTGAEAMAWGIMFVVMPLSGVFYPVSALPAVLRPLAWSLPTTHAFVALRGLVDGHGLDRGQVLLAAVSAVALLGLGFVFLTRMLKVFRRRGLVTRYS